ncbi:MAG: radical SAM protein, partial [Thermoprotei archaeon]
EKHRLITRLMNEIILTRQEFLGVEVGIETGSTRLAKTIMPAKAAPYPTEKWPEVVVDAFRIMHENRIIPAATLILGLPKEREDDLVATAELLDELKQYRSLIVPMFFVPMGALKNMDWFRKHRIKEEHIEIMLKTLYHSLYWAEDIVNNFYLKEPHMYPVRLGIKILIKYIRFKARQVKPAIEAFLQEREKKNT